MTAQHRLTREIVGRFTDNCGVGHTSLASQWTARNFMERSVQLANEQPLAQYEKIPRMGVVVQSMVRDVLDRDDEVDDLYERVFSELLDLMLSDSANVHRGIHYQSTAKYLERIGDHGTNLAEQVIFALRGTDIRHPRLWRD